MAGAERVGTTYTMYYVGENASCAPSPTGDHLSESIYGEATTSFFFYRLSKHSDTVSQASLTMPCKSCSEMSPTICLTTLSLLGFLQVFSSTIYPIFERHQSRSSVQLPSGMDSLLLRAALFGNYVRNLLHFSGTPPACA